MDSGGFKKGPMGLELGAENFQGIIFLQHFPSFKKNIMRKNGKNREKRASNCKELKKKNMAKRGGK